MLKEVKYENSWEQTRKKISFEDQQMKKMMMILFEKKLEHCNLMKKMSLLFSLMIGENNDKTLVKKILLSLGKSQQNDDENFHSPQLLTNFL